MRHVEGNALVELALVEQLALIRRIGIFGDEGVLEDGRRIVADLRPADDEVLDG
jgi:hypothetical protein